MQTHTNIEKPTARLYYNKLIESTDIDATWNMVKCKVSHLKGMLKRANEFTDSTGAGVEDGDGSATIRENIMKICPHYDQLSEIFARDREVEVAALDTSQLYDCSALDGADINVFDTIDCEDESFLLSDEPTTSSAANALTKKVKRKTHSSCIDKLAEMEADRTNFRKEQLELEKEKFEWTKELKERKLETERQKQRDEFELKKMELEQNKRLKIRDLELKYANNI